jgi:hypothetical protein
MYTGIGYGAKLGPIGKRIVLPSRGGGILGASKFFRESLKSGFETRVFAWKRPELGALGDLYRYISESLRSLGLMQKNKVMEMGTSRFFID